VVALGVGSPNVAGWPTTMAMLPTETTLQPKVAPLSLADVRQLAIDLSERA
jgi:hypothetical protein